MYFKSFLEVRSAIPQGVCKGRCLCQPCFAICPASCLWGTGRNVTFPVAVGDMGNSPSWCLQLGRSTAGKRTGPKLSSPWQLKKLPTNPGLLCLIGASPLLFCRESTILLCLQLNPNRTEGPKYQYLSPARKLIWDTVPGVTHQLLLGTDASAHSPSAWIFPLAVGEAAYFSRLNQLLEPRVAEKSTKMPKLSTL